MRTILSIIQRLVLTSAVILLGSFSLLTTGGTVFADDPVPCTAPPNDLNGVHWPVGADAVTFTYQCDGPYAGYWTNAYYKYDPITTQRYALYSPDYAYDCTTNQWSMTEWDYSPATGAFYSIRVTPTASPDIATNCPVAPSPTQNTSQVSTPTSNSAVGSTGPDSTNSSTGNTNLNATSTNNTNLLMANSIFSNATTGNTFVIGNTSGGSATSGDAQSIANVANLLQTTSNVFGPNTITFVANINGDVNGDFMFDPSALLATGPGSANTTANNLQINSTTTNNASAQINNNVDVGATSGTATVADNTSAGNATTGSATAVANLMNLINSTVEAGHSFVGTVNINGNFNGDILLPQSFVDQLMASTGPGSTNGLTSNVTDNSTTTNNTTAGISNNVTSTAQSGTASVLGNTSAGNALSGLAGTNVTLLNLTGSNVVGRNDLLVFVNVQGHWVGMIVNAPSGTTTASLGGGITGTGPDSLNAGSNNVTSNTTTTNNANLGITNDVNVHATSGNATVASNTFGGNATSGNARTAVNILNIAGSNLNLSNWFGILFINVFGNWTGSFGVNTSAGDPLQPDNSFVQTVSSTTGVDPAIAKSVKKFATFFNHNQANFSDPGSTAEPATTATAAVLGNSVAKKTTGTTLPTPDNVTHASFLLPAIGISVAALMLLGERVAAIRKNRKEV